MIIGITFAQNYIDARTQALARHILSRKVADAIIDDLEMIAKFSNGKVEYTIDLTKWQQNQALERKQ